MSSYKEDQRTFSYLVGIGVTHSIAPPMHDYITKNLGYDWKFLAQECPTVEDAVVLFRLPTFAGGVVTMPYKTSIMKHLDGLDLEAERIGACNNVYRAYDGSLRGTNTDWRGIQGCLLETSENGKGKPALVVGAGGASRAALYALIDHMNCKEIYVVNRDAEEIQALLKDAKVYSDKAKILHLESIDQAKSVEAPFYIVGTVPDFEPRTASEIQVRMILEHFLSSSIEKGVVLDMCFKPRRTRVLKLGDKYGWQTVEGTGIIGHQIDEQYRLWCGDGTLVDNEGAWRILKQAADSNEAINF